MTDELIKPTLMIIGIMGFIICITYTISGNFSEWLSVPGLQPEDGFDFGTNLGIALSVGFLLIFIGALVSITPRMIDPPDETKMTPNRPKRRKKR